MYLFIKGQWMKWYDISGTRTSFFFTTYGPSDTYKSKDDHHGHHVCEAWIFHHYLQQQRWMNFLRWSWHRWDYCSRYWETDCLLHFHFLHYFHRVQLLAQGGLLDQSRLLDRRRNLAWKALAIVTLSSVRGKHIYANYDLRCKNG